MEKAHVPSGAELTPEVNFMLKFYIKVFKIT